MATVDLDGGRSEPLADYLLIDVEPVIVSSAESGGGSSVPEVRPAPGYRDNTTPPTTPSRGGSVAAEGESFLSCEGLGEQPELEPRSFADAVTQTDDFCVFSAKTCMELIGKLTDQQLEFELQHFETMGYNFPVPRSSGRHGSNPSRLDAIKLSLNNHLAEQTGQALETALDNCETLSRSIISLKHNHNSIISLTRESQLNVDTMLESPPPAPLNPATPVPQMDAAKEPEDPVSFDKTVCDLLDIDLKDITIESVLEQFEFDTKLSGGRRVTYFGDIPYQYSRHARHDARQYPEGGVISTIFDRIGAIDPDFCPQNFTCLATLYPDGSSFIPRHSDDETSIQSDSLIYTASFGEERSIVFLNTERELQEHVVPLSHGSVYTMSSSSQAIWSHAIPADQDASGPRVSFTFRRLTPEPQATAQERKRVPPIQQPKPVLPTIAWGTHKRILLLTDSVLLPTPTHIFNKLGDYRCIKKANFELINVLNFEAEFKYCDMVIFSSGVNDLSRYGKRAHVLADLLTSRLSACLRRNPDTTFIFNSILSTSHEWLNWEVEEVNRIMFELSAEHHNFLFFDSHHVLMSSHISSESSRVPVIRPDDDGVHITSGASRIVTKQLVNAANYVAHVRTGRDPSQAEDSGLRNWTWPLRPRYTRWHDANSKSRRTITCG